MKKLLVFVVVAVLAFSASVVLAEKPLTPDSVKGGKVVDDATVKANHGKVKIFDVRMKAEYVESHIAGAISVPYDEKSPQVVNFDASKDSLDLAKFPGNKNEEIYVYCNGPRCWKSYKAAVLLIKAGYKNVGWYREGFPSWKAKGYAVE